MRKNKKVKSLLIIFLVFVCADIVFLFQNPGFLSDIKDSFLSSKAEARSCSWESDFYTLLPGVYKVPKKGPSERGGFFSGHTVFRYQYPNCPERNAYESLPKLFDFKEGGDLAIGGNFVIGGDKTFFLGKGRVGLQSGAGKRSAHPNVELFHNFSDVRIGGRASLRGGISKGARDDYNHQTGGGYVEYESGNDIIIDDGDSGGQSFSCGDQIDYSGEQYGTVEINDQCWMAENLNVGTRIDGDSPQDSRNGVIEKYCYNDQESNCDSYGGLYQWEEAMQGGSEGDQGICPSGWHIPEDSEWHALEDYYWDGSDSCDPNRNDTSLGDLFHCPPAGDDLKNDAFNALLAGSGTEYNSGVNFNYLSTYGVYWTSLDSGSNEAFRRVLDQNEVGINRSSFGKSNSYSVRCIRN